MLFRFPCPRSHRRSFGSAVLLAAGVLGLFGCGADGPGNPLSGPVDSAAGAPASVTVSPGSASGNVGQTGQFLAVVKDAQGHVLSGLTIVWSSSNTAVVSVTSSGLATGVGGGSAAVIATVGSLRGQAQVTVTGPQITVGSVVVAPGSASGNVGDSAQFTATAKDTNGNPITGLAVTWSSSNTSVLSVSQKGMARAVGSGSASVTATAGGKSGSASVTVSGGSTPPASIVGSVVVTPGSASGSVGDAAQFTATVLDTAGATLTGQAVTWKSTNAAVVTVSSTGYATAVGGGSATLVATAGGKSGQAAVTVSGAAAPSQASVASISVSPSSATISVGGSQQLSAVLKDSVGNVLTGRTVTWSSNAVQLATVSAIGLVAALVPGNLTITASSGGKSGSASITVAVLAPPPSQSGSWPNEPSGMTLYNDQPWSSWGAWQINDNQSGNSLLSTVSDAPFSPSGVFEDIFPVGTPGGGGGISPGRPDYYFPSSSMPTEVYVGLWAKLSSPYQPHSSGVQKLMYITDNNDISFSAMWLEIYGTQAPMRVSMVDQFTVACPTVRFDPNVTQTPINPGEWHRYEVDFKMASSSSANDGTMRVWVDGVLNISATNVCSLGSGSNRLERVALSGMWGGAGDTKTETDFLWYDHTRVSGR